MSFCQQTECDSTGSNLEPELLQTLNWPSSTFGRLGECASQQPRRQGRFIAAMVSESAYSMLLFVC